MPEDRIAVMPDGNRIRLPAGASDAAMDKAAKDYISSIQPKQSQTPIPAGISAAPNDWIARSVSALRSLLPASSTGVVNSLPQEASKQEILSKGAPIIEGAVGAGVTAATGMIPGIGPTIAGPAGSLAMGATNQIIKGVLGQPASVGEAIKQGVINEVGGRILGPALGSIGEKSFAGSKLGNIVKFEDLLDNTAGRDLINSTNYPTIDKIIENPMKLHNFMLNGKINVDGVTITSNNARKDMQGYVLNKLFYANVENGVLNPNAMMNDFKDFITSNKVSNKLFSNEQINTYTDFLNSIKSSMGEDTTGRQIKFDPLSKSIVLSAAIYGGHAAGLPWYGAAATGHIGTAAVASILKSKTASSVFLNLMNGQPLGMSIQGASRIIMNSLTRQPITLQSTDGRQSEGIVGANGEINPR